MLTHDFGVDHAAAFPAASLGGQMFAAVVSAIEALGQESWSQASGRGAAKEGTSSKAVAPAALRDSMEAISRTARAMSLDTAGLDDKFRMPHGVSDKRLLAAARGFAQDAQPLVEIFVAHAMPATFLAGLSADIDHFEQAEREHASGKDAHIAARAALEASVEAGFAAVQRLDAIVTNTLGGDRAALAVWHSARHVERTLPKPAPLPGPVGERQSGGTAAGV